MTTCYNAPSSISQCSIALQIVVMSYFTIKIIIIFISSWLSFAIILADHEMCLVKTV